jgi:hypothetical protein
MKKMSYPFRSDVPGLLEGKVCLAGSLVACKVGFSGMNSHARIMHYPWCTRVGFTLPTLLGGMYEHRQPLVLASGSNLGEQVKCMRG